jgi:hypothetical protein
MHETETWDWRSALENGSRRTPAAWQPRPGDHLAGTVVALGTLAPSRFDEGAPYIDIKVMSASERDGESIAVGSWVRLVCNRSELRKMFELDQPQVGDRVAVQYDGKESFESGRVRAAYRSVVEKPTEVDW